MLAVSPHFCKQRARAVFRNLVHRYRKNEIELGKACFLPALMLGPRVRKHAEMIIVLGCLVRAMHFCLFGTTIILAAIQVK